MGPPRLLQTVYPMMSIPRPDVLRCLRSTGAAALVLTTAALTGCGNLTAGGFGEAGVVVSGDAPETLGQAASTEGPPAAVMGSALPAPLQADDGDDIDPEGQLDVTFEIFLRRADGSEIALSDDELQAELDLSGDIEADVVRATLPADAYPELRILFREIEVQVDQGVIIGGQEITGPVDVDIEDLEVVRALDLEIRDGDRVELLLDLNAATWLAFIDPTLKTVNGADFASAFTVRTR